MNRNWKTEILVGVRVTTEWDNDKDVWRVIAIDGDKAWIRNTRTNKNLIDNAPFLFPTTRTS